MNGVDGGGGIDGHNWRGGGGGGAGPGAVAGGGGAEAGATAALARGELQQADQVSVVCFPREGRGSSRRKADKRGASILTAPISYRYTHIPTAPPGPLHAVSVRAHGAGRRHHWQEGGCTPGMRACWTLRMLVVPADACISIGHRFDMHSSNRAPRSSTSRRPPTRASSWRYVEPATLSIIMSFVHQRRAHQPCAGQREQGVGVGMVPGDGKGDGLGLLRRLQDHRFPGGRCVSSEGKHVSYRVHLHISN